MPANGVDGSVTIEINADSSQFNQELTRVTRQAQSIPDATIRINANANNANQNIRDIINSSRNIPDAIVRIQADISQYQQQIRQLQQEIQDLRNNAGNGGEDLTNKFEDLAKRIGGILAGLGIVDQFKKIGQAAVESYSSYEQLVGGVDTLFKDSSQRVQEYAANAYKTAGVSANEYMEQVTSFSASLLQSLGGNTKKAADISNQAIIDMSDNANKMGTAIGSIQNAYQGFAKQNYTMLDNLKLGYGGTKKEMERLIADANEFREQSGRTGDLTMERFSDVIEAIHEVQVQLGITGTTAEEAEKTLEGSAKSAEAAWKNLMTALADPTQDLDQLIDDFIAAKTKQIENLLPTVEHTIEGIGQAIDHLIPELDGAGEELAKLLTEDAIPALIDALKWLVANKEVVATALKGMVASAAISGFVELGKGVGKTLAKVNKLTGSATTLGGQLANLTASMLGLTEATGGAAAAATAFGVSLAAWGLILTAVTVGAIALANAINQAAREMEEASKIANGFSDTSNDVLDRYAQIANATEEEAKKMSNAWIEADRKMLQSERENLRGLQRALEAAGDAAEQSGDWTAYNDLYRQVLEAERNVQTLENIVHLEEKYYDDLEEAVEEGSDRADKAISRGYSQIEGTITAHEAEISKMRQLSIANLGGEEGLKELESYWDNETHYEKEEFDEYWKAKEHWLDLHYENTQWWWNEKHKIEDHYQKEEEKRQKEEEKKQKEREAEQRKQEQEAAKAEREHLNALKTEKENAYRDINISAYSQTFEDDLAQTKYILDKQLEWLTANQSRLTKELYDKYYEDWLKAYDSYQNKVQSQLDKEQKQREQEQKQIQQKFSSAATSIYSDTRNSLKGEIKDVKSSFKELIDEYDNKYKKIIKQRDDYKKQLMGGSVFEVLQKTDEKTGEQYTEYTINNLKERVKKQAELAKYMDSLKKRGLAKGLSEELMGMDVEDAAVFAKQMSKMSDAEFNELNNAYKKLDEDTTRLANEYYQDELDDLNNNFITKANALFDGLSDDMKTLGVNSATDYIDGYRLGWESGVEDLKKDIGGLQDTVQDGYKAIANDVDEYLDGLAQSIDDGTADISKIIEENLVTAGLGDKMVDAIINEIDNNRTELQESIRDLFDIEGYIDLLYADIASQSAKQSSAGYSSASAQTQTANQQQGTGTVTQTAPQTVVVDNKQSGQTNKQTAEKLTIDANLVLTDKAGQIIADIVNAYNKRIEIGVGK